LQGGPKYSTKTRIGNWNEDLELTRIQDNNYRAKKEDGSLPFAKTISKYQQSYRQVPWTHSPDGNLRWNDYIMVQNQKTDGWLVMDIGGKVQNVDEGFTVTSTGAGQNPGPMTRSVFKVVKEANPNDLFMQDQFVRYGQYLRLEANPYLYRKRLLLQSAKQSSAVCAPLSLNQVAYVSAARQNADSLWVLEHIDPQVRFEMQGEIVRAGEPVLLKHVTTCVYLGADPAFKVKNDFGQENEVHCFNHSSNNKTQQLALEKDGRLTIDVTTKLQLAQNIFCLHTAPDASYARSFEELAQFDGQEFMKNLKSRIALNSFGIKVVQRIFQEMDKGDHCLDVDDFRWGLLDYGTEISKEDAVELQKLYPGGAGKVHYVNFINALKVSKEGM